MSNRTKKIGILCIAAVAMVVVLNMIWGSSAIDEYKKTTPTELPSAAEKVLHEVLTYNKYLFSKRLGKRSL